MAALKLGEEAVALRKERDHLQQQVRTRTEAATSSDSSASAWKKKCAGAEKLLEEERKLKLEATNALAEVEKQLAEQVKTLQEQIGVGKQEMELAEGRVVAAEARAVSAEAWAKQLSEFSEKEKSDGQHLRNKVNELVGVINEEQAANKTLKTECDQLRAALAKQQAEEEQKMDDFTTKFLYNMWLEHPEIDYSFFGAEAIEAIRRFEADVAELVGESDTEAPEDQAIEADQGTSAAAPPGGPDSGTAPAPA